MKEMGIIDLHCDLLGCVEYDEKKLNFDSEEVNCSIPQLLKGNVKLQTFALATVTREESTRATDRQAELYKELLQKRSKEVGPYSEFSIDSRRVHGIFSIENASGLATETAPLDEAFSRFDRFSGIEKILYVSLTWNHENRFGGGNDTDIGLKRDGELLLEYLDGKKTAIDLSHTSDQLAFDIINTIDKKGLDVPIIASHSNYREIRDIPRNLPDELVKEIVKRKGLIGLNFVRRFVGEKPEDFLSHIHHAFLLGASKAICLGADFYGGLAELVQKYIPNYNSPPFFEKYGNAGLYGAFLQLVREEFTEEQVLDIAHRNVLAYLEKNL